MNPKTKKEYIENIDELTTLNCFLDGNALCITRDDFKDIQESEVVFLTLTDNEIELIKKLSGEDIKQNGKTKPMRPKPFPTSPIMSSHVQEPPDTVSTSLERNELDRDK